MNFDQFTGHVQHRLELPGTGESVRAIRATLMSLGERLRAGEAEHLASSLPMEVDFYLTGAVQEHGQRFDWQEFVERVREREGMTHREQGAEAAYHARVVVALVAEIVAPPELRQVRDQLPADEGWEQLFELVDSPD
jgi:uncharacterized protein (DUF2267 family)